MRNSLLCYLVIPIFFFIGCGKPGGKCETPDRLESSEIVLEFKNSEDRYLYDKFDPIYEKEEFKVFDEKQQPLVILYNSTSAGNTSTVYYTLSFGPLFNPQTGADSFNKDVCKKYYLHFNENESDSLEVCFKARKTACGSVFDYLKVSRNGQTIVNETQTTYAYVSLIK